MKHAGSAALDRLEPLLGAVRKYEGLREKGRGVFYAKSRAFLHFHEAPAGLFADLRVAADWQRLSVNSPKEWNALLAELSRWASRSRASS